MSNNTERYINTTTDGLSTTVLTEVTDIVQWQLIPAETAGNYYIKNRATGNYINTAQNGLRVKATSNDITGAVAFKLVLAAPGEFFIQRADNADVVLYNYATLRNQLFAGKQTGANAKWQLRLEENMLAQPKTMTDEQLTIYYIQRTDNREYAYHKSYGRGDKGRISSNLFEDPNNFNYWFYFTEGHEEGKYAIYNYATGLSVTADGTKLYANKEAEVTVDYTITLNEEKTGLVISAEEGDWNMPSTNLAELSTKTNTTWLLQRVRTISLTNEPLTSLTIDKEQVTLTENDSIRLSVETAPVFATDHSVTWSSSNTAVATVDATGMVKAISEGNVTITATANDGSELKATCEVTVSKGQGVSTAITGMAIQIQGSVIAIDGLAKGTAVNVYDAAGKLIATAIAANGATTIDTRLPEGNTAIVKIGEYSMKVSL